MVAVTYDVAVAVAVTVGVVRLKHEHAVERTAFPMEDAQGGRTTALFSDMSSLLTGAGGSPEAKTGLAMVEYTVAV